MPEVKIPMQENQRKVWSQFNFLPFPASNHCMTTSNDDIVLHRLLHDPASRDDGFRALMKQYGQMLYWHIRRIVVGHDDAEDVMQETCIKVLKRIDTYKGDGPLVSWLYRIATNEALLHLRRQTHLLQSIDTLGEALTAKLQAEASLEASEAETLFQQALLTLPTQQRIAFNMRYYDELSYEDIARVTGKSVNTLKTNYHYATQKVKTFIQENMTR